MNAALRLSSRILGAQLLIGGALYALLLGFGPQLLVLDDDVGRAAVRHSAYAALVPAAFCLLVTWLGLRRRRFVLRAIALGSSSIEARQIADLAKLPGRVTALTVGTATITIILAIFTELRPSVLDDPTATSMCLLGVIIVAMGALPLYVLVRAAIAKALELVPPELVGNLLDEDERRGRARRRLVTRAGLAIVAPVGFIALGAALVTRAHVRQFDQHARERTAQILARSVFDAVPGSFQTAGRFEAAGQAGEYGYTTEIDYGAGRFAIERGRFGRTSLTSPLEDGTAVLWFEASELAPLTSTDIAIALIAILLSAALGTRVGRALADDLGATTRRVRRLRIDAPGIGQPSGAPVARYAQVTALDEAIEALAGKFRVFAAAQEKAIDARATARKMRSLLFAGVSHDLRDPLNSILGFTDLVETRPLAAPQRESLGFIRQRGRELLALIVVILDTAKIEAGRLTLDLAQVDLADAIAEAVKKGTALVDGRVPINATVDPDIGLIVGDRMRLVQALSAVIDHCARTSAALRGAREEGRPVPLTALRDPTTGNLVVRVTDANGAISNVDFERLLSPDAWVAERRRYGGLTLGLTLARMLVERHGGTLRARGDPPNVEIELVLPKRSTARSVSPRSDARIGVGWRRP